MFWIGVRLQELVAHGGSTVFRDLITGRLIGSHLMQVNCIQSRVITMYMSNKPVKGLKGTLT